MEGKVLVAHAPTGLGKTAVALTASLERSRREGGRSVFLTPRQSQHRAVIETVRMMPERISVVDILSREDMCPHAPRPPCLEDRMCILQADWRMQQCAREVLARPMHAQELVSMCLRRGACPYLTARMACDGADLVVGDYSRVFSPLPDVIGYRSSAREQNLVVDEAHNLPSQTMDAFSIDLFPSDDGPLAPVWRDMLSLGHRIIPSGELRQSLERHGLPGPELIEDVAVEEWVRMGDAAVRIAYPSEHRISLRFLEPGLVVNNVIDEFHSAIFMSGTLHPPEIFASRLGLNGAVCRTYPSPFDPARRLALVIPDVGTRFRDRCHRNTMHMALRISELSERVRGNVMVFLPSYALMRAVHKALRGIRQRRSLLMESPKLSKAERDSLAGRLSGPEEVMMLCHIRGSFSEGVDLPHGCVSAVLVAGMPVAPPSLERREMVRRAERTTGGGYDLETYEALSLVLQACGRAIRREEDRAAWILMDPRYLDRRVLRMLPPDIHLAHGDPDRRLEEFFHYERGAPYGLQQEGERIITGH